MSLSIQILNMTSFQKIWSVTTESDERSIVDRSSQRSIPVVWTLVLCRRLFRGGERGEILHDGVFAQATPFDLETITQERTLQNQNETNKVSVASSQNVIEITTHVFDTQKQVDGGRARGKGRFLPLDSLSEEVHSCLYMGQSIILRSSLIRNALQSMVEYYPKHPPSSFDNEEVAIEEPFAVLIHHFPKIDEYVVSEEKLDHLNQAAHGLVRSHLVTLRDFLKPIYEDLQSKIQPAIQANAITFDLLWYILQPGIDVYIATDGVPHVCVIESVSGKTKNRYKPTKEVEKWSIRMWCLDTTDGLIMSRKPRRRYIKRYNGMRNMTSLPVCPVSVWDTLDAGARRAQILHRNGMYLEGLQKNQNGHVHCFYDGPDIQDGGRVSDISKQASGKFLTGCSIVARLSSITEILQSGLVFHPSIQTSTPSLRSTILYTSEISRQP